MIVRNTDLPEAPSFLCRSCFGQFTPYELARISKTPLWTTHQRLVAWGSFTLIAGTCAAASWFMYIKLGFGK